MALKEYTIKEFRGIDQSRSENSLDNGYSPDACNMDTENGDLAVGKGYVKHIPTPVPGTGEIRRLYIWRDLVTVRYVVIAGREVYAWRTSDETPSWILLYTYSETGTYTWTGTQWDFLEARIGNVDYLIIANGERQLIKWDGESSTAVEFGSEAQLSNIAVNYLALHYDRLFSAGDQAAPSRLYWSKPPGDGKSIEDWSVDDASQNASGGHVEVGNTDTDPILGLCSLSNQLLIFKRDSIYRLHGDRPDGYRITKVNAEVEEMCHTSCILYGDTPFWMTGAGMYYFDGQTAQPMPNARNIRNILDGARLTQCKGAENRDRLYFTCRKGDSGYQDDSIIVYDVPERAYMLRNGFQVADICAKAGTLYLINSSRYVYRFNEGDTYDGEKIDAYWKTPSTDLGNKPGIKSLQELYLRGISEGDGEGAAILIDATIGRNTTNYRYLMPEQEVDVLEIPMKNEGRTFSLRFSNEEGSRWAIRGGVSLLFELRQRS